jgi:peptidyl-prolyl cis-trans isomerase A (cyclophilin A)
MTRIFAVLLAASLTGCGVEAVDAPPELPPSQRLPAPTKIDASRVAKTKVTRKPARPRPPEIAPTPASDGWMAPASTRDPKACEGMPEPTAVELATLTPTPLPANAHPALTNPRLAVEKAPDVYRIKFETSEGDFVVESRREWSPIGSERLYNLAKIGFFDDIRPFRNIGSFMVQFGISGSVPVNEVWKNSRIPDEPVVLENRRGVVTFAKCGAPNCRSTQLFINHKDNLMLDPQGFSGVGRVIEGMDVVDRLYACYGESSPRGKGPRQNLIQEYGNAYLDAGWPLLSKIERATILP